MFVLLLVAVVIVVIQSIVGVITVIESRGVMDWDHCVVYARRVYPLLLSTCHVVFNATRVVRSITDVNHLGYGY